MNEPMEFANREEFREWLLTHCQSDAGVWLLFGKAGGPKTLKAKEALEEALCFGWIDGQMQRISEQAYKKYFSMRRNNSKWSEKNNRAGAYDRVRQNENRRSQKKRTMGRSKSYSHNRRTNRLCLCAVKRNRTCFCKFPGHVLIRTENLYTGVFGCKNRCRTKKTACLDGGPAQPESKANVVFSQISITDSGGTDKTAF